MNPTKYPVLRQTLILLSFIALMALFFAINHLIFIPQQQQVYNNKIFRVLLEVREGFEKATEGQADVYAKNFIGEQVAKNDTAIACSFHMKQQLVTAFRKLDTTLKTDNYTRTYTFTPENISVSLRGTGKESADTTKNILIQDVLNPSIQFLHKDLFDLVMLVKRDTVKVEIKDGKKTVVQDQVLYTQGDLTTGYILPGDTLFKTPGFGQFSSISNLPVAGTDYKAFGLPFKYAGNELVLVGFVKESEYKYTTTSYSKPTVLWIVSLLVLFILSLPLMKVYLSSRQERISTTDVRLLMVVFTAIPFFVVLTAATLLLYRHTDKYTNANLQQLHENVEQKLHGEIELAIAQLKKYDSLIDKPDSVLCKELEPNRHLAATRFGTADLRDVFFYPDKYKNVEDIFWVNEKGKQIAKWFFINQPVSYLNVSTRNYFQKMRNGQAFILGKDSFYIEPTISWSTGMYSVNIVIPSHRSFTNSPAAHDSASAIIAGLAGNLYSVCDPVMPKGYQFCIADEAGAILFHSQTIRSLHENLFDESNRNFDLKSAFTKRGPALIPDVLLFDRHVKMYVAPMHNMPSLYLVTYFAKREQNLYVFHISAFTLLCITLVLFSLLLLMLLYYFFGNTTAQPRFHGYESAWLKPSEKKRKFYLQNMVNLLVLAGLFFLFLILLSVCDENYHWFVLQASMALPFAVTTGYFILRNEYNSKSKESNFWLRNITVLIIYFIAVSFLLLIINLLQNYLSGFRLLPFLCIALFCASSPLIVRTILLAKQIPAKLQGSKITRLRKKTERRLYLRYYTLLVLLSIFMISVLPTLGIFSFAVNQEKQIHIKATQFDLAKQIEKRRDTLNSYFKTTRLSPTDTNYIRQRKLSADNGIYLLAQQVDSTKFSAGDTLAKLYHSPFYQSVTRFLFLPKDHADFFENTESYYWYNNPSLKKENISFVYKNEKDRLTQDDIVLTYIKADGNMLWDLLRTYAGRLILLSVMAFFIFHYMMIKATSRKIFLLDYFGFSSEGEQDEKWTAKFYKEVAGNENVQAFFDLQKKPLTNTVISNKEETCMLQDKERVERILHIQHLLTPAYDAIWKKLKSEEKFLLYDFALDGFSNYKNADLLYALYNKGLIRKREQQLELMNYSFRNYLLGKTGTEDIIQLEKQLSFTSTWKNLKNIFFVMLFAILIFLFATQQDVSNKIIAIVSGLATLVPLLLKIFDRGGSDVRK